MAEDQQAETVKTVSLVYTLTCVTFSHNVVYYYILYRKATNTASKSPENRANVGQTTVLRNVVPNFVRRNGVRNASKL